MSKFHEWVLQQSPDRFIYHATWITCAVGDYFRSLGLKPEDCLEYFPEEHFGRLGEFFKSHKHEPNSEVYVLTLLDARHFETYGELQEFIKLPLEKQQEIACV